jgi:hypothetical protein
VSTDQVIVIVFAARLLVPLFILRYPLPGIVAAMTADLLDGAIFSGLTGAPLEGYQNFDKALDTYYLAITYVAIRRTWADPFALRIATVLWYVRLGGVAAFSITDERALLFIFPATFELFVIYYELVRSRWDPARLSPRHLLNVAVVGWLAVKLPHEYWVHVAQGSTTEWLKTAVFNVDPTASRWDAVSANPLAALVLAGSLGAVVVVVREVLRTVHPPDHGVVFDASVHLAASRGRTVGESSSGPASLSPAALGEKIVILSLLAVAFAEFLPGVRVSVTQVVLAVSLAVVTAGVMRPRLSGADGAALHPAAEFGGLSLASLPALALTARWTDASIDFTTTVFYALLFTLFVTLYDRARDPAPAAGGGEVELTDEPPLARERSQG